MCVCLFIIKHVMEYRESMQLKIAFHLLKTISIHMGCVFQTNHVFVCCLTQIVYIYVLHWVIVTHFMVTNTFVVCAYTCFGAFIFVTLQFFMGCTCEMFLEKYSDFLETNLNLFVMETNSDILVGDNYFRHIFEFFFRDI